MGYWPEMEQRINESDFVIFLDVPISVCKERAQLRIHEEAVSPNISEPNNCFYSDVIDLQMSVIENFDLEIKAKLVPLLNAQAPAGFNSQRQWRLKAVWLVLPRAGPIK